MAPKGESSRSFKKFGREPIKCKRLKTLGKSPDQMESKNLIGVKTYQKGGVQQ